MNVKKALQTFAIILVVLAVGVEISKYIPVVTVKGNAELWAMLSIACGIVGATIYGDKF